MIIWVRIKLDSLAGFPPARHSHYGVWSSKCPEVAVSTGPAMSTIRQTCMWKYLQVNVRTNTRHFGPLPLEGFLPHARHSHLAFTLHSYSGPPSPTCIG